MIKVCTTFSGYDSQCLALDRLGLDYELVAWSEIEPNAIKAHNALYPQYKDRNLGDISKIDWNSVPDFDFLTYSSPCTDFSSIGLQMGGEEGSGTRSSLLWEVEKAIRVKRPRYLLMENVSALVGKKFKHLFDRWLKLLENYGYKNYYKVLSPIDYGISQTRRRVFVVSILGEDGNGFSFPDKAELKTLVGDYLENDVDNSFYLTPEKVEKISKWKAFEKPLEKAKSAKDPFIGCLTARGAGEEHSGMQLIKYPMVENPVSNDACNYVFRKITPRECFRFMGLKDNEIDKVLDTDINNRNLYKLAGNSIVVDVLSAIYKEMFLGSNTQKKCVEDDMVKDNMNSQRYVQLTFF